MHSLRKLNRTMQTRRIEGKVALRRCCLAKQTLIVSSRRLVQQNPWATLGIAALMAGVVARGGRLSRMASSVSSLRLLLNGVAGLNGTRYASASQKAATANAPHNRQAGE